MGNKFCQPKKIHFYNCDANGELFLPAYLGWSGEIAGEHLQSRGISREKMLEERQIFLLSHVSIRRMRPAGFHQQCEMQTWEVEIRRAQMIRAFALTDSSGDAFYRSISSWVLVDPASRKIIRPSEYRHSFDLCDAPVGIELERLRIPSNLAETGQHCVRFSELDGNRHLSNRFYGSMLLDFAPEAFLGKPIRSADIAFIHEAKLGQTIHIFTAPWEDGGYYMSGLFEDGSRCFEARTRVE